MIRYDIKFTDFYNELSKSDRQELFYVKKDKFLSSIDNIYYSCFIEDDFNGNVNLKGFFEYLDELKTQAVMEREPQPFRDSLVVESHGTVGLVSYKYCISMPDLYDIFILDYLPNENTPRIQVQIRAFGLWVYGVDNLLIDSFNMVSSIFSEHGCRLHRCRENRIDYCYHTNAILAPEKTFDRKNDKYMNTTLTKYHEIGSTKPTAVGSERSLEYISFGQRKSNNIFVRIYNKGLEVVEKGYKGIFFKIWEEKGLISFYDRYCYEYAYVHKDFYAIEEAKLHFYLEYGKKESVKKEFRLYLSDPKTTYAQIKDIAQYMPKVTTVMNIEFQTKRKFYYYSDEFIENVLQPQEREGCPTPLDRIFRIVDNRSVFLEYLTSTTLNYSKNGKYKAWWERLRNTKLGDLGIDEKLLRDYSQELDDRMVKAKFINSVASNAVYSDNIDTEFIEDVSDILSVMNDNDKVVFKGYYTEQPEPGSYDEEPDFYSMLLCYYKSKKIKKERRLKNRKKKNKKNKKKAG